MKTLRKVATDGPPMVWAILAILIVLGLAAGPALAIGPGSGPPGTDPNTNPGTGPDGNGGSGEGPSGETAVPEMDPSAAAGAVVLAAGAALIIADRWRRRK